MKLPVIIHSKETALESEDRIAYEKKKALERLKQDLLLPLPLIIKIGQVMDLCFELLPEAQRISCMEEVNNKKISDIYELFVYDEM